MRKRWSVFVIVGLMAPIVGCGEREDPVAGQEEQLARYEGGEIDGADLPSVALATARRTADELTGDLGGMVMTALRERGPVAAVEICSGVAQERTAAHATVGVYVRRVTDRLRNPLNAPDAGEAMELERMARLHVDGSLPEEIVRIVRSGEGDALHYLRPILIAPPCLTCHGTPEEIDPEVRAILGERYPADAATGYRVGDLRGAVSVRVDLREDAGT